VRSEGEQRGGHPNQNGHLGLSRMPHPSPELPFEWSAFCPEDRSGYSTLAKAGKDGDRGAKLPGRECFNME
jgi:hypothetical protein